MGARCDRCAENITSLEVARRYVVAVRPKLRGRLSAVNKRSRPPPDRREGGLLDGELCPETNEFRFLLRRAPVWLRWPFREFGEPLLRFPVQF